MKKEKLPDQKNNDNLLEDRNWFISGEMKKRGILGFPKKSVFGFGLRAKNSVEAIDNVVSILEEKYPNYRHCITFVNEI